MTRQHGRFNDMEKSDKSLEDVGLAVEKSAKWRMGVHSRKWQKSNPLSSRRQSSLKHVGPKETPNHSYDRDTSLLPLKRLSSDYFGLVRFHDIYGGDNFSRWRCPPQCPPVLLMDNFAGRDSGLELTDSLGNPRREMTGSISPRNRTTCCFSRDANPLQL